MLSMHNHLKLYPMNYDWTKKPYTNVYHLKEIKFAFSLAEFSCFEITFLDLGGYSASPTKTRILIPFYYGSEIRISITKQKLAWRHVSETD